MHKIQKFIHQIYYLTVYVFTLRYYHIQLHYGIIKTFTHINKTWLYVYVVVKR